MTLDTGNLNIGGIKNEKGESLGQYVLLQYSNNSYPLGFATKSWYDSRKNSFEENDCFISNKATDFGFGIVCFSDGCFAMAYFYPSDAGFGLVN